ncbi:hypothetical protein LCGC14_2371490 [marine sediment metagenome]|uniref:Uncharacterized protein n=1 Tax=marine sediment metagenome TaxID=412755 RepID=A0A0F9EYC1_9ZZZZ
MASGKSYFSRKTVLVTGAARRLGAATALALAAKGARVVLHYNTSADQAEQTCQRARQAGVEAWTVQADLSDPAAAAGLWDGAVALAGPVDFLINNASIFPAGRLADLTAQDLTANVNLHALAPLLLGRALADQGRAGAIVNFLDCRIDDYDREHVAYHLSKRMLFAITRMMAVEFAPAVRVNAVAPGLIIPETGRGDSFSDRVIASTPLGRQGSPADVVEAVEFLLASEYVTGQVIYVDGGRHMKGAMYG